MKIHFTIPDSVNAKLKGYISRGISAVEVDENGHLILTLTDGSVEDLGKVSGDDGVSVTHEWDGTTLRVTSASGTSEADLKGDKGERGEPGTGLAISGSVATYADLPVNLTLADAGEAYFVEADGKLYIWSGTAWPASGEGSQFKGEKGDDGVSATHSWNGTVLTVTSASGTSSSDLKGDKGDAGYTPQKGVDYFDGAAGSDGATGVGIASVQQTTTSTDDDGNNIITVTLTDGTTHTFTVQNGSKGSAGQDGVAGSDGADGKSAYQAAVEGGYEGTEAGLNAALAAVPDHISDTNKHITAEERQTWDAMLPAAQKGAPDGVAELDDEGKVPAAQLPETMTPAAHAESHKTGGSDPLAAADIGAAPGTHASQHASGGSDPLTPTDIGEADYIVAQGTSGEWYYRKWNSGKAECWAILNDGTLATTAAGSLYSCVTTQKAYPFTFTSWPRVFVSPHYEGYCMILGVEGGVTGTLALSPGYILGRPTPENLYATALNFYVIGNWK